MSQNPLRTIIENQKAYFATGKTKEINHRLKSLKKLDQLLLNHEKDILEALHQDLKKSNFEAYSAEFSSVRLEIKLYLKKVRCWSKKEWVCPNSLTFPAYGHIHKEPYGCVLNIAPWNYPFLLALMPMIGAIGAGNTCVIKPSEISKHTSSIIAKLINENFEAGHIHVVEGDATTASNLLNLPWNYIFFTGSPKVGSIVYQSAAKNLIPVTLELGGKSPCIVTPETNLEIAARRIAWGKFSNAGQTCVAPDYLVLHESIKADFIKLFRKTLIEFYGENPKTSKDYGRIISLSHFDRLTNMAKKTQNNIAEYYFDRDNLYIAPLIFENIHLDSPLMQEEIFGPLLPCLTFSDHNSLHKILSAHPKPLAFYIFSNDKEFANNLIENYSFGGGCVNDVLMHLVNHSLPFGGVGASGIGNYHGKKSFDTFTHAKGVLKQSSWIDFVFRYPPYTKSKMSLLKWITK